ncbi:hypothetical protein ABZS83_32990 [Streptomyces sp. NPDC005426]|uniref:hypothetical protein n=1 Tax=Streptomyces sp. NPDC005426 TaxID=3155344 RepID=UPI0033A90238
MTYWIAFWTALWVGSEKITRWTVDWLCNARPAPAQPTAKPAAGTEAKAPDEAGTTGTGPEAGPGEQQPKPATKGPKPAATDAEGSALLRWFGVLVAAIVTKTLAYTTIITASLAAAWVLTALVLGYAAALPNPPAETADEAPADDAPADEPHPSEILTREHVALLLAEVYTEGSGVHLATLAKHLARTPLVGLPPVPWATRDVRALLARHEVRVRDGVRVPPKGGREGVHRDDFPPLPRPPSEPPVVGVVVPGQSNNNNASNGYPFTVTDDPANPSRHTVHHTERR